MLGATALVLCAIALAGCTHSPDAAADVREASGPAHPWADVITSAYKQAGSDRERDALRDGVISEQEYTYFRAQIVDCLHGLGITAEWSSDGALEYSKPAAVSHEAVNACNKKNGIDVIALRDAMERNPRQLDESEILVACLKRAGSVDPGYTAEMLDKGIEVDEFMGTKQFDTCNADPLELRKHG
jgi:hypothetical protein